MSSNGYTSSMLQLSLMELVKKLFEGRTFNGQEGREPLSVYRQDLPIPTGAVDTESDRAEASAPFVIVRITGGRVKKTEDSRRAPVLQNIVNVSLIICAFDAGSGREGWLDAENIKEAILQKLCGEPYFGGAFTVLTDSIEWAYQSDDSPPYYFCGIDLDCTAPLVTQNDALKGLI